MEGRLLGGLAGQDGVGPVLVQEGGSEGVSSQDGQVEEAIAWNRGGERVQGSYGIVVGMGKMYVNAFKAMTLWGAAKFRQRSIGFSGPKTLDISYFE